MKASVLSSDDGLRMSLAGDGDRACWDGFVESHALATPYHQFAWRDVIRDSYGHEPYYVTALRGRRDEVLGVLPLIHLRSLAFGTRLVSMPFVDSGGPLSGAEHVESALLSEALQLANRLGASRVEIRCERPSAALDAGALDTAAGLSARPPSRQGGKVRMLLPLPGSPTELFRQFKSKLRSQINRPLKAGCAVKVGGLDLLEDFYKVFLLNMRDLGSPVHSKELMRRVLEAFPENARIFAVYYDAAPVAASLVVGFNGVLRNPWASSDRRYAAMSPNMLLYSRMLEFACDHGYHTFDFGRSTPGEGTYQFKAQWGAQPAPLHWYVLSRGGEPREAEPLAQRFGLAARVWRHLPLAVTRVLGPRIRKHISL